MNAKDKRIAKFWDEGCSVERISKKLGLPDTKRVIEGLVRMKRMAEPHNPERKSDAY